MSGKAPRVSAAKGRPMSTAPTTARCSRVRTCRWSSATAFGTCLFRGQRSRLAARRSALSAPALPSDQRRRVWPKVGDYPRAPEARTSRPAPSANARQQLTRYGQANPPWASRAAMGAKSSHGQARQSRASEAATGKQSRHGQAKPPRAGKAAMDKRSSHGQAKPPWVVALVR